MNAGRIGGPTSNRNSTRIVSDESKEIKKTPKTLKSRKPMGNRRVKGRVRILSFDGTVFWAKLKKDISLNFVAPLNGCKLCEKN